MTGEIGLLGGILRDLAETVAAQDRDVADLKGAPSHARSQPDRTPACPRRPPRGAARPGARAGLCSPSPRSCR